MRATPHEKRRKLNDRIFDLENKDFDYGACQFKMIVSIQKQFPETLFVRPLYDFF